MLATLEICSIRVLRLSIMLVPTLYPHIPVAIFKANSTRFIPRKNRIGPMIRPSCARDAPMVAKRGARQN